MPKEETKRLAIEVAEAVNSMVMNVVCPPGTLWLAAATAVVAPAGMGFPVWALYLR
jgi:hypothetical protein